MRIPVLVIGFAAGLALLGQPIVPATDPPKTAFNRLYANAEIVTLLKAYAAAYPAWMKLEVIGRGGEGGEIWAVTITNPRTGEASAKPAIYVDAATHANEIQGTEVCLYLIQYVLRNYGKLPRVTELLDRGTIYVVPMVNVDSRRKWFTEPATASFPRTVPVKIDDDRDGRVDEDGYDDLDGDGEITMMRKKVPPGQGRFKLDPRDRRLLVPVQGDELGDYVLLGNEGIDNDGDGMVNEDLVGYIDPNRTYGAPFLPRYAQAGAPDYPLQVPETRAVAEFIEAHPNIVAGQCFHNSGGYILHGPFQVGAPAFPAPDMRALTFLGREGEKMLPHYKFGTPIATLGYGHAGGSADHMYFRSGVFALSNELNTPKRLFNTPTPSPADLMAFNDVLTQGRQFVDWKPYQHPTFGEIEIGGYKHDTGRPPEGFLLEEECHRNASFVLFHAHHMPRISLQEPAVVKLAERLWSVQVPVLNDRALPSMAEIARRLHLHRRDLATVEGAKVVASGVLPDPLSRQVEYQTNRPERLLVNGVPGFSTVTLFFLVEGAGEITISYDSVKAGKAVRRVTLQ